MPVSAVPVNTHTQVLVTRNLTAFKRLPSPIATLQINLYTLLQSASAVRAAFTCCLGVAASEPDSDGALLDFFHQPPQIALVQGNVDPGNLISRTRGESPSASTSSGAPRRLVKGWTQDLAPDDPREVLFLPWALHSMLETAAREGDAHTLGEVSLMTVACLLYETAHWLYERVHGHRPQENLRTFAGSSVSLEGMIAARKESDVGMRVLALLLGADFELITFIDGSIKLVKLRLPAPHPPLLSQSALSSLLSSPAPRPLDVTAYGTTRLHTVPNWRADDLFPVVKIEAVGGMCQHGDTTWKSEES